MKKESQKKLTVVIPTRNEGKAIKKVIESIPKKYEILVIDKSEDDTAVIAKKTGVKVVLQKTKGKGNAMREAGKLVKTKYIAFIDGDGTYPANKFDEMLEVLEKGEADVVIGTRKHIKGMSFLHLLGNKIFSLIASLLYGRTTDLLTGLRMFRTKDFNDLGLKSKGFEVETELHIRSMKKGLRLKELPIEYEERIGESKLSAWKDGLKILKTLLKYKFSD